MGTLATPFISNALARLRGGISLCCGVVALSLLTQILVWGVATFMDERFVTIEQQATPETVVSAAAIERQEPIGSPDALPLESPAEAKVDGNLPPPNPNRVATKSDLIMSRASALAMTCGTIAMLLMIPMLMVGVMLSAGSATPGVDSVVSAFMWSLFVSMLVLPIGQYVGLPWSHGGFVPYEMMTKQVDIEMADGKWGTPVFHARFGLLPLACLVGVGIVGLRFSNGVRAGVIKEDVRLDPTLEREASGIRASSLLGGRNTAALRSISPPPAAVAASTPMASAAQPAPSLTAITSGGVSEITPGMLQATAGEAPKRLI